MPGPRGKPIFDRNKGKANREDTTANEGGSDRFQRKRNWKAPGGSLVAVAERKGGQSSDGDPPDFFEKKLEGPCPNHAYTVKHAYKDFSLIRQFLAGRVKRGGLRKKEPAAAAGEAEAKEDDLLVEDILLSEGISQQPMNWRSKSPSQIARRSRTQSALMA